MMLFILFGGGFTSDDVIHPIGGGFTSDDVIHPIGGEQKSGGVISLICGITEIDQIKFDQIEKCFAILNLEVDHDKLFKETISLQNTYKEVNSYREPLFVQIEKYVGSHKIEKQIDNEVLEESDDEELVHKTPTQTQTQQDSYHKIRPD
ncbi:unnamed protein product [Rotaria sordida]|uniref:Uncharacterized protein n=1 Tax=Rotaria sordida TaxID=392033 RepID=A0A814RYN0_9BILA|nr:unnamed protein product [Rotaria sordida]CAF1368016.1 unnamed protein product [Rotaria sordida]CAF3893861.1 unnamed protein product [Rotaria sordida]